MKLGLAMVVSAVSLFSGTVIWSTQKTVERAVYRSGNPDSRSDIPVRRSDRLFFYSIDRPLAIVNVNAPVSVELDEGFTGVELHGDTSLFSALRVTTQYGILNISRRPLRKTTAQGGSREWVVYNDSLLQQLKAADIRVRVGIGAGADLPKQYFDFKNCKKVSSATPVQGGFVHFNLFQVDSTQFSLRMKAVEVHQNGKPGPVLALSGSVNQLFFSQLVEGKVDTRQLHAREVYVRNAHKTDLELFATEIANLRQLDSCTVKISGNPPFTKISEVKRH